MEKYQFGIISEVVTRAFSFTFKQQFAVYRRDGMLFLELLVKTRIFGPKSCSVGKILRHRNSLLTNTFKELSII